jgi:hypothetical protein
MGGFGSTRWESSSTRQTVESIHALDIRAGGVELLAPIVWLPGSRIQQPQQFTENIAADRQRSNLANVCDPLNLRSNMLKLIVLTVGATNRRPAPPFRG